MRLVDQFSSKKWRFSRLLSRHGRQKERKRICVARTLSCIEHADLLRHDWIHSLLAAQTPARESCASIIAMMVYSGHAKLRTCKSLDEAVNIGCALLTVLEHALQEGHDTRRIRWQSCHDLLQFLLATLSHSAFATLHDNHADCAFAEAPRFQHVWVRIRSKLCCILDTVLSALLVYRVWVCRMMQWCFAQRLQIRSKNCCSACFK